MPEFACLMTGIILFQPERFVNLGIEPPKGVLLFGPPGTGKTLCARAVANRTDACFIRVIGSELVQKYVGEVSSCFCFAHCYIYVFLHVIHHPKLTVHFSSLLVLQNSCCLEKGLWIKGLPVEVRFCCMPKAMEDKQNCLIVLVVWTELGIFLSKSQNVFRQQNCQSSYQQSI